MSTRLPITEPGFRLPLIPDVKFASVSRHDLRRKFRDRVSLLENKKTYSQGFFSAIRPTIGSDGFRSLYKTRGHQIWKNLEEFKTIDQGHQAWSALRTAVPLTFSASNLWALLLMGHGETGDTMQLAKQMKLPESVKYDPTWEYVYLKSIDPLMKGPPDDIYSHLFMLGGTVNENSILNTYMTQHPEVKYRDQGSTFLTPEILDRANLIYKGKKLRSFGFLFSASPDGLITESRESATEDHVKMENDTGTNEQINHAAEKKEITVEWKGATMFIPKTAASDYNGVEYFYTQYAKPYAKPKYYYCPQLAAQQLCCETEKTIFGCWTITNGMNVWEIKRNDEYITAIFVILDHLYANFVSQETAPVEQRGKVPNGYFLKRELCGDEMFNLYRRFVQLTLEFASAPMREHIPKDVCYFSTRDAKYPDGVTELRRKDILFPDVYKEFPSYFASNIFCFFVHQSKGDRQWISTPKDLEFRFNMIAALADVSIKQLLFICDDDPAWDEKVDDKAWPHVRGLVADLSEKSLNMLEEHRLHLWAQCHATTVVEKYVNAHMFLVFDLLYRLSQRRDYYRVEERESVFEVLIGSCLDVACRVMVAFVDEKDVKEVITDSPEPEISVLRYFARQHGMDEETLDREFGTFRLFDHVAWRAGVDAENFTIQEKIAVLFAFTRFLKCADKEDELKRIKDAIREISLSVL